MYKPADGFPYYISLTKGRDVDALFTSEENDLLLASVSEEKSSYRYQEGKWSIKQILGHITDHERIMVYRALRFSRKDTTPLPGYDQELLVNYARFNELPYNYLLEDYMNVRKATNSFIKGLSKNQMELKGLAWKFELTVEETLRATIGHEFHHIKVLKELYNIQAPVL